MGTWIEIKSQRNGAGNSENFTKSNEQDWVLNQMKSIIIKKKKKPKISHSFLNSCLPDEDGGDFFTELWNTGGRIDLTTEERCWIQI